MTLTHLFLLANAVAVAGWLILIIGVLRKRKMSGLARWAGALLAIGYLVLFIFNATDASVLIRDYSVASVQQFFSNPELALLGWVHILAFDLWVGAWEVDEAPEAMPRTLLIIALLLTWAVGPIGLGAFLIARRRWK